jgi:hypothetical protein
MSGTDLEPDRVYAQQHAGVRRSGVSIGKALGSTDAFAHLYPRRNA